MSEKEFLDLEAQVKNLIKLSKQQLKESNIHLLKKNKELSIKEQKLSETLTSSAKKIERLIKDLKKRWSNLNGKEYYKSKNFRSGI